MNEGYEQSHVDRVCHVGHCAKRSTIAVLSAADLVQFIELIFAEPHYSLSRFAKYSSNADLGILTEEPSL
jgi:hypothetical protein